MDVLYQIGDWFKAVKFFNLHYLKFYKILIKGGWSMKPYMEEHEVNLLGSLRMAS